MAVRAKKLEFIIKRGKVIMYAVIQTGGKQYRVKEGDVFVVEKLAKNAGETVTFDSVLLIEDGSKTQVGKPTVAGATVSAQVLDQTRGDKVIIFKKKRRHNYRRKNGHRQDLTLVKVFDISASGGAKKTAPEYKARVKKSAPTKAEGKAKAAKATAKAKPAKAASAKKTPAKKKAAE